MTKTMNLQGVWDFQLDTGCTGIHEAFYTKNFSVLYLNISRGSCQVFVLPLLLLCLILSFFILLTHDFGNPFSG